MSTPRILTKNTKKTIARVPNSLDFIRTMDMNRKKLEELNYSISPDLTLVNKGKLSDIFKSKEVLEKKEKEAYFLLEKINVCHIKNSYDGTKVNDYDADGIDDSTDTDITGNPVNIKIYDKNVNEHLFNEKLKYYRYLTKEKNYTYPDGVLGYDNQTPKPLTGDFDLEEYVKYRGPVVIAQEFYGCGAKCTELSPRRPVDVRGDFGTDPKYDTYDDRITKIWSKNEGGTERIIIEEYYRANVDSSIKYKNPETGKLHNSVGAGVFDFIPGLFSYNGKYEQKKVIKDGKEVSIPDFTKREPALYTFDYKKNIDCYTDAQVKQQVTNWYINNSFLSYEDFTKDGAACQKLRLNFPAEGGGTKQVILIHRGLHNFTASEGCLTIFNIGDYLSHNIGKNRGDYIEFMKSFLNNSEEENPLLRVPKSKVGLLFLFRDQLF